MSSETKFTAAQIDTACEILRLAMSDRGDKADVFVTYSGHIEQIDVRIHTAGWINGDMGDLRVDTCTGYTNTTERLAEAKRLLLSIPKYTDAELRAQRIAAMRKSIEAQSAEIERLEKEAA